MSFADRLKSLLEDPPPEFAFEIGADGVAMARTDGAGGIQFAALRQGVLEPGHAAGNIKDPDAFAEAVRRLVPAGLRGKKTCALILPDSSVRVAILDFDSIPEKEEERRSLIRFRLRKSLPFDLDSSMLSYHLVGPKRVLAAVATLETIAHYEEPFRAAGLQPGLVTVSSLAMLDLVPAKTSAVIAKLGAGVLTVCVVQPDGILLMRSLDLDTHSLDPLGEISDDLYPTLAYVEDHTGSRPGKLWIAGFGEDSNAAATRLAVELELPVEVLPHQHAGLAGYLSSLPGKVMAAA